LHPRIKRTRRGDFEVHIPEPEREVLRGLPTQLRELLASDDPALQRLFPPAHPDDPESNDEYERLVRDDLVAGRRSAVEVMEASIDAARLDEDQLVAWLSALNDLRLILGTRLEVTEDLDPDDIHESDPQAPTYALFYYLGWLEEQAVQALASGIDPSGTEPPERNGPTPPGH
jgi:hypothetical protein